MIKEQDPYFSTDLCASRIVRRYEKEGSVWVAFDFDDTIHDYHNVGHTYDTVLKLLKRAQDMPKFFLICWTANPNTEYVKDFLEKAGLKVYGININPPWLKDDPRKIVADIYLDDRAGLGQAVNTLRRAMDDIVLLRNLNDTYN